MAMIRLPGRHNVENVMAALLLARLSGCPADTLVEAVSRFSGVAHRIEYVATRKGVAYYDDSKGTNVDAVKRALETFETPVALLMGGRDKEGDFASLLPAVRERVRGLFLFGEARERIGAVLGNAVPTETVPTLREAVLAAAASARSGDVVLLSPGCASFDAFRNYKERGRFFRRIVEEIADV
jgi:UDP-N-acetylmuramoylalanine--D-glutamate ligase